MPRNARSEEARRFAASWGISYGRALGVVSRAGPERKRAEAEIGKDFALMEEILARARSLHYPNRMKAGYYYEKAAESDFTIAIVEYGLYLEDYDPEYAMEYLRRGARRQHTAAMRGLGRLLCGQHFFNDDRDFDVGFKYFMKAAALRDAEAYFEAGIYIESSDEARAIELLRRGVDLGSGSARVHLQRVLDERRRGSWTDRGALQEPRI